LRIAGCHFELTLTLFQIFRDVKDRDYGRHWLRQNNRVPIFETLGVPVFYADDESKNILFTDSSVLEQVRNVFGDEVFTDGIPDEGN
jgi:hypothetical protein